MLKKKKSLHFIYSTFDVLCIMYTSFSREQVLFVLMKGILW